MELNCHYNQQARLKEFARLDGNHYKLTMVDLERKKIGSRNVEKAFYQKGLYSEEVERELNSKIEAPGMRVFDKAYKSNGFVMLTRRELETMKKYLLLQLYRNPTNISHYSPNWEGDVLAINKKFKNDAEAKQHVSDEIHKLCNNSWRQLLKIDDEELNNNIQTIRQTMTLFVRSPTLEFVINDLGSVTERQTYDRISDDVIRPHLESIVDGELTDDMLKKWKERHQYYDNFTFYPISSHMGVITVSPVWTALIKTKQPFTVSSGDKDHPIVYDLDPTFFDWVEDNIGLYSDFLEELFVPGVPSYQSPRLKNRKMSPRKMEEMVSRYMRPDDKYIYPVVDLDLMWAKYLNRLTINEAHQFFAFGSINDGKISISDYDWAASVNPGVKNDLSWIDWDADWTDPIG